MEFSTKHSLFFVFLHMKIFCGTLLIVFVIFGVKAQEPILPADFRQHNLTEYNSSLLNPAYVFDRNNASSVAFWARWQWQILDADPTSLFLSYSRDINESSAASIGFFQHNTGIFINTGGSLNYGYEFELIPLVRLGVGINVFGYQQKLADQRFFQPNPIQTSITNDFVLQVAPGINLKIDKFSLGLASENLIDYNFSTSKRNTSISGTSLFALASYDFPVSMGNSDGSSVLRPALYVRTIPGMDTQAGLNALLSTNKFWAQGGYNNFYGISAGFGGRFFKRVSIGALVEFGISSELDGQDPSFEVVTAYKLGSPEASKEEEQEQLIADEKSREEEKLNEELAKAEEVANKEAMKENERLAKENAKRIKDSIQEVNKASEIAVKESRRDLRRKADSIQKVQEQEALAEARALDQKRIQDSIALAAKAKEEAIAIEQRRVQDSIISAQLAQEEIAKKKAELERLAQQKEVVKPQAGEKYEEVAKEGVLEPGYYLIANVFGTKRYFDAFMADLQKKGLEPKSFFRESNKYNYVYLERYNSIQEARKARDSNFGGKYPEKTWIFRVVGK